jgi:hypothetical protein
MFSSLQITRIFYDSFAVRRFELANDFSLQLMRSLLDCTQIRLTRTAYQGVLEYFKEVASSVSVQRRVVLKWAESLRARLALREESLKPEHVTQLGLKQLLSEARFSHRLSASMLAERCSREVKGWIAEGNELISEFARRCIIDSFEVFSQRVCARERPEANGEAGKGKDEQSSRQD